MLANYMLGVMNPSFGKFIRFFGSTSFGPTIKTMTNSLKIELAAKMQEHGFDQLSQLYKVLAIR